VKLFKLTFVAVAAVLAVLWLGGTADAFHSGGVAECVGCHSMHSPTSDSYLLVGGDQSSTCLSCHEGSAGSYHISTADADMPAGSPPLQKTPGGDFGWIKKTYTWNPGWAAQTEEGDSHGHNIVATDFSYAADGHNITAPGGGASAFPANQLACISCHDPHGKYKRLADGTISITGPPTKASGSYNNSPAPDATGSVGVYRLLAGNGYSSATVTFSGNPAAVVPSSYNRSEATTQTRTAYGAVTGGGHQQWGQWCATCHGDMHSSGNYVHPVDEGLGGTEASNYNLYIGSGNMGGSSTTSFLSLVPFIENTGDYTTLATHAVNDDTQLGGPGGGDRVSCLSCHRAHASGFEYGLRWNAEIELIVVDGEWPGTDAVSAEASAPKWAMGRTQAEMTAAYYDQPSSKFAAYQRSLCNKCHAKD